MAMHVQDGDRRAPQPVIKIDYSRCRSLALKRYVELSAGSAEAFEKAPRVFITKAILEELLGPTPPNPRESKGALPKIFVGGKDYLQNVIRETAEVEFLEMEKRERSPSKGKGEYETHKKRGELRNLLRKATTYEYYQLKLVDENARYEEAVSREVFNKSLRKELYGQHFDKVAQRDFAAERGIFDVPRYEDFRNVNRGAVYLKISPIPFSSLDAEAISKKKGCKIIDHPYEGLTIITDNRGLNKVYTGNPSIAPALESYCKKNGSSGKAAWLKGLFNHLEKAPSVCIHHACEMNADFALIARALLNQDEPIYLKSARTSGGEMVIKIGTTPTGEKYLESNSLEMLTLLDDLLFGHERRIRELAQLRQAFPALAESTKMSIAKNFPTIENALRFALLKMKNPIVEEEIERITRGGDLVEFRLICIANPMKPYDPPEVCGHYSKVSPLSIAANVSLGGHGETTISVLEDLYREYLPQELKDQFRERASETLQELLVKTAGFADAWSRQLGSGNYLSENSDYAVDIIPKWNSATNRIEFTLLEVQVPYGYSGLKECDPEMASIVEFRSRIMRHLIRSIQKRIGNFLTDGGEK